MRKQDIVTFILVGLAVIALLLFFTSLQEDAPDIPRYEPTSTPTPTQAETIVIEITDGVPTAVAFTSTPTPTPEVTFHKSSTVAPTPTQTPATPTRKPTERVEQAKPTNTPTPTKKPAKTQNIVPYPTGAVGTQYVDSVSKHHWKPYARYTAITAKGSREYALQQIAETNSNGLRVVIDPKGCVRYCIALAPQWAGGQSVDIGRCIDITMENGTTLHCVLGDVKKHEHTQDRQGRYGGNGELIEFQVDMDKLPEQARKRGDISYVSAEFEGGVVSVTVLDLYIDGFGRK